jgi:hypothetical protein
MNESELQHLARKRVAMKTAFALHGLVYLAVNAGLVTLSLAHGGRWHWGPLLGWGLGLAIHGAVTLLNLPGGELRQRMVDAEVQRLRARG